MVNKEEEENALIYKKQKVFGMEVRTNGYGIFYEKAKSKTQNVSSLYTIGLDEIKHPKEDKQQSFTFFGNPYIYGKINNFYTLKLGYGQQRVLGQKGNKNGVAVLGVYSGGATLGLLRPYYIDVQDNNGDTRSIKYTQQDSTLFVDGPKIGSSGLGKGWNEIKVKPGLYAKAALRFDWGRFNELVTGLEAGISAEFYAAKIPIMLYQKDQQFFFQGHIAFLLGKRK